MELAQGNKCKICNTHKPGGQGRWHTDHCHTTGKVRGLLCSNCNIGIGNLQDSVEILQSAIKYLTQSRNV